MTMNTHTLYVLKLFQAIGVLVLIVGVAGFFTNPNVGWFVPMMIIGFAIYSISRFAAWLGSTGT
jgi:hypothetical protein